MPHVWHNYSTTISNKKNKTKQTDSSVNYDLDFHHILLSYLFVAINILVRLSKIDFPNICIDSRIADIVLPYNQCHRSRVQVEEGAHAGKLVIEGARPANQTWSRRVPRHVCRYRHPLTPGHTI